MSIQAYRASLLWCRDDPARHGEEAVAWHEDGLLIVEDGHIAAAGDYAALAPRLPPGVEPETLAGRIVTPGFVDAHTHYPQTDAIASHGSQLLDWLGAYIFPAEAAFGDKAHAAAVAGFFLDELLRNGTTSALVFGAVQKASAEALFEQALDRNMRIVGGKVLMDRFAPDGLLDGPDLGRADTEALIKAWHGRGRLGYAVTPRFALSCSDAQLRMAGEVLAAHPGVLLHTHLSENLGEIAEAARLFPEACDYLDAYDRRGLVGERSVFAHGVHLDDRCFHRLAEAGSAIAFCPSSNLFLGSGLFDLKRAFEHGVTVGLGTDIGAGTSFSLLATAADAYKVGQLRGSALDPFHAFYLATLGGAKALKIDGLVGALEPGREADFLVLDPAATPLLARRTAATRTLAETLFALMILGDDRVVERTYVAGRWAILGAGISKKK
jgi:guanine deaminase